MDWRALREPAEVEQAVRAALPPDAAPRDVWALADQTGLECSDVVDGVVHCSAPAKSRMPFVSAQWLLTFGFDDGRLARVDVEKGLTGP